MLYLLTRHIDNAYVVLEVFSTSMSNYGSDENSDEYADSLHSSLPFDSQLDSGYLTFASSCASPVRLSPSAVAFNQLDSPASELASPSPHNPISQKFVSTIDYENYLTSRKYFDILTQLHHRNAQHLLEKVFKHLTQADLRRSLLVSKSWYHIVRDHHQRRQTKSVKRNLFSSQTPVAEPSKLTSTPMRIITNTTPVKLHPIAPAETDVHLTASTMTFRYGYLKYLHGPTVTKRCPLCAFVSIVDVNDQHGYVITCNQLVRMLTSHPFSVCTNPLCGNSFCQYCSGPYHPSSPCKTTIGPIKSPWRQRPSISPIFSNKTRNNLRRLLMR